MPGHNTNPKGGQQEQLDGEFPIRELHNAQGVLGLLLDPNKVKEDTGITGSWGYMTTIYVPKGPLTGEGGEPSASYVRIHVFQMIGEAGVVPEHSSNSESQRDLLFNVGICSRGDVALIPSERLEELRRLNRNNKASERTPLEEWRARQKIQSVIVGPGQQAQIGKAGLFRELFGQEAVFTNDNHCEVVVDRNGRVIVADYSENGIWLTSVTE